jgi:hypothetical protein
MDASVAKLVDRYADNVVARDQSAGARSSKPEEVDVDALFDELEAEDDGVLRERRLAQLQKEYEPSIVVIAEAFG